MKKINTITLLLFLLIWQINAFSQFYDLPIQNQKDYRWLDEEIQKTYKKSKSFSHKDTSLRLFMVFNLHPVNTITKEEYTDGSFLTKLRYDYVYDYKNKNKSSALPKDSIVYANITVYSSEKNFVANFSYGHMRFFNRQEMSSYFKRQNIKLFFNYRRDKRRTSKKAPEVCYNINKLRITDSWGSDTHQELRKYMWNKGNFFIFTMPEKKLDVCFIINEQLEVFVFFKEPYKYETYNVLPIREFINKHWERFAKEDGVFFN